jgi:hypothetical protein
MIKTVGELKAVLAKYDDDLTLMLEVASVDGDWVEKRYIDPAMIGMSDTSADYSDDQENDPDGSQMGDIDKLALTIIVRSV